eukprot:1407070-Pleurochrysis_carterae.AAC.2
MSLAWLSIRTCALYSQADLTSWLRDGWVGYSKAARKALDALDVRILYHLESEGARSASILVYTK